MLNRRQAIKTGALASLALTTLPGAVAQTTPTPTAGATAATGPFQLPTLPYAYDALEPYIDARTMQIHHDKHHAAYVANLNKAVAGYPELGTRSIEDLLKDLSGLPQTIRTAVRNNGGGHYNHSLFWLMMKPGGGGKPDGGLANAIDATFGGYPAFQDQFGAAALAQFGSGWAWLVLDGGKLRIEDTPNQDSPVSQGRQVLLGLDVWEHAYYLKNQNRRADYVAAWWNVVDWSFVRGRYEKLAG